MVGLDALRQAWASSEARSLSIRPPGSRLFLIVAVVLLPGCLISLPTPSEPQTSRPTPQPVLDEMPLQFEGSGGLRTARFALGSGRYAIDWSLTPVPGYPCRHRVRLESDRGRSELVLALFIGADDKIHDTTYAWDLMPGTYHFHVNSTCDWTLLIDEDEGPS